ncbi:hypothetical protein MBT84_32910 [Streptomyces sp. MBT84]|uniref:hypothetical protein n=1 Tax=Streptomyces sp. MBT84 TaxID=1488414 RepID=UPI001C6E5351|nr:hypothetical protein [Streptomyces sp. MBT84]MBW8704411.1 hypothetical protein [Streptomyces sp. MBT84]
MGIRLIVEVLDHWQDAGLTPGERWDLLVLAENANDGSRLTFGPVHAQHILERANKSPKGWKNAITALMRKKVITTHVPGRIKQVAVYHLEHLCPDPPHSGYKGHCTKPVATPDDGAADASRGDIPTVEEDTVSPQNRVTSQMTLFRKRVTSRMTLWVTSQMTLLGKRVIQQMPRGSSSR